MVNRRLSLDVDHYLTHTGLRVVPPPCPIDVEPGDFRRAAELVARGYDTTRAWLDSGAARVGTNPIGHHEHRHGRRSGSISSGRRGAASSICSVASHPGDEVTAAPECGDDGSTSFVT
jgi:hypothetical protein